MNRRFFIFLLSFLLAHAPLAFAPQGHDLDSEAQDEGRLSPALLANDDASTVEDKILQAPTASPDNPASEEICRLLAMPVHLRNILQFLTFEQLKACKWVSKEWYRAATYVLSLKSGFRLKLTALDTAPLPPINTPPLPPCTGLSCETTVVAVPDPTAEAADTPQATPEDTHEDTSEVAPPADRDRVSIFLENLCRGASQRAWETPRNPLKLCFDDNTPLVFEALKPASVLIHLPVWKVWSVPNFQHVRHVFCRREHVTDNLLAALQKAKLETLDLTDSTVKVHCILPAFEHPESLKRLILARSNMAGFHIRPLVNLTHLNINRCKLTLQDTWSQLTGLTQLRVLLFDQRPHRRYDRRLTCVYDDRTRIDCVRVLTQNTNLTELNLNGHVLGPAVADALENKNLRILQLHGCGLGDAGFQKLALLNLEKLVVSRNGLTEDSVTHLCSTLRQVNEPHLRHLDLGDNALGDDVMLDLAAMTYLDKLYVPATGMTDQGASNLMALAPHLKMLNCDAYKDFSHSMYLSLKEHFKRVM